MGQLEGGEMTRPITLHPSNLPIESPAPKLAIVFLLLAHFNPPEWAYWALGAFSLLAMMGWVKRRTEAVQVDLFAEAKKAAED